MTNKNKINEILDMIDSLQENLLSLPDDMLLSIDPRDNDSLSDGVKFITDYNDKLEDFSEIAKSISDQLKNYFGVDSEISELDSESLQDSSKGRIIAELDKEISHSLTENFTYKRPYGFVLQNKAYKGLKTWKSMYMLVLEFLKDKDDSLFKTLPAAEEFISKKGNHLFSYDENDLRVAESIDDFYAEVNLSSNGLIKNICKLLEFYDISISDMRIYLREDRDA